MNKEVGFRNLIIKNHYICQIFEQLLTIFRWWQIHANLQTTISETIKKDLQDHFPLT